MTVPYLTTDLLTSIRRRARATNSAAPGFADADLLAIANEVLMSEVTPEVVSRRASFFRQTINTTLEVGTSTYRLSTRTIGSVVANFFRVDSTDNSVHPLVEWDEEDLNERDPTKQGTPQAFIIQGNYIRLYPVPSKADVLRQVLLRRPNRLVLPSTCGLISSAPNNLLSVTMAVSAASLGITTSTPTDLIRGDPHFDSMADSATPTAINSATVGYAAGVIPAEMNDGTSFGVSGTFYVCLAGEAPVIQLPPEFFPVVAQRSACELLRPGRDRDVYRDAVEALKGLEEKVYGVVVDRIENQPGYLTGGDWPP